MNAQRSYNWLAVLVALAMAITPALTTAKKPDKPGGGDGGDSSPYSLITLAPPGVSITESWPTDLDEFGNVVGAYKSDGQLHSFYYNAADNLWITFGDGIRITGLNNLGQLVGYDELNAESLLWDSPTDPSPVTLNPLIGYSMVAAVDINDAGVIIGDCFDRDGNRAATAWRVSDTGDVSLPVALPHPAGDSFVRVYALNESDSNDIAQVVGASGQGNPGSTALRWEVGVAEGQPILVSGPTDVGSLDGSYAVAYGLNFPGDIVGESGNWPFLKSAGQAMVALDGIAKAQNGVASDINHSGVVVGHQGYLARGRAVVKAVIWTTPNSAQALDKQVNLSRNETLEGAGQINDAGDITGLGYFPGISEHGNVGFLLMASP